MRFVVVVENPVRTGFCYFLLLHFVGAEEAALRSSFSVSRWLHEIQKSGYDKLVSPGALFGQTTDVQVEMYVENIGNFRSTSMDYEMDVFFIEHWTDTRLSHNQSSFIIFSDKDQLNRLWTPDIYFANSKTAHYNYVMVPNMNFRIWPNGKVRLGTRVAMKILCHMNLTAYPIDSQICKLKILTCATAKDIVNVTWINENSSVTLNDEIVYVDLAVQRVETIHCTAEYYGFSYSCLEVRFHLTRNIKYSLLQTYFPTSFIVMISWISFWIDPMSVPGRVGLALTTLLTMSTQAIAIHIQLPPVGYAKALDVWFGICMFFLFGSLIEFAVVNMYTRIEIQRLENLKLKQELLLASPSNQTARNDAATVNNEENCAHKEEGYPQTVIKGTPQSSTAMFIDKCSRLAFPIAFLLFCTIYWSYYLSQST